MPLHEVPPYVQHAGQLREDSSQIKRPSSHHPRA